MRYEFMRGLPRVDLIFIPILHPGRITNSFGYDFHKGQRFHARSPTLPVAVDQDCSAPIIVLSIRRA